MIHNVILFLTVDASKLYSHLGLRRLGLMIVV